MAFISRQEVREIFPEDEIVYRNGRRAKLRFIECSQEGYRAVECGEPQGLCSKLRELGEFVVPDRASCFELCFTVTIPFRHGRIRLPRGARGIEREEK